MKRFVVLSVIVAAGIVSAAVGRAAQAPVFVAAPASPFPIHSEMTGDRLDRPLE